MAPIAKRTNIPAKSVALPIEHGAWGFLFEPLLAGVILAPSIGGGFISVMIVGAFLSRQPLKFYLGDLIAGKTLPRTGLARKFAFIFAAITIAGLAGSLLFASWYSLIPLAAVAPLAVYLIAQDIARQSRQLWPELVASVALASSITAVALAGGVAVGYSLAFWALMVARLIPSVLYVRSRLKLEKGKDYDQIFTVGSHLVALAAVAGLYYSGLSSILTVTMAAFFAGRAAWGISGYAKSMSAKALGIREVIYGVLYALSIVIGYYLSF